MKRVRRGRERTVSLEDGAVTTGAESTCSPGGGCGAFSPKHWRFALSMSVWYFNIFGPTNAPKGVVA